MDRLWPIGYKFSCQFCGRTFTVTGERQDYTRLTETEMDGKFTVSVRCPCGHEQAENSPRVGQN